MTIETKFSIGDTVSWQYTDGIPRSKGKIFIIKTYTQESGTTPLYGVKVGETVIYIHEPFLKHEKEESSD